jgi:16S rRNA (guanine527-N7)-methyltransferase
MTSGAARVIRTPQDFAAIFDVSRETLQRLLVYERLLRQWQKAVNLVAPSTLDDIWHRHFADSAQLLPLAPAGARTWVDLGSGAGFPGLVVAMLLADKAATAAMAVPSLLVPKARLRHDVGEGQGGGKSPSSRLRGEGRQQTREQAAAPHPNPLPMPEEAWGEGNAPRVTLIESNARKCAFLREVVRQTGIGARIAVDILSTRIETAATQASLQAPDVVSARALAPLDKLLALAAPLFTPDTTGLFMKGREAAAELEAAKKMWDFKVELVPSRAEPQSRIVIVRQLEPRNEGKQP